MVRDLNLPKKSAEILTPRLNEKYCLQPVVTITSYRTREQDILPYFTKEDKLVFCSNISGLLSFMGLPEYMLEDWRLLLTTRKEF